jgi:hypothetical protein
VRLFETGRARVEDEGERADSEMDTTWGYREEVFRWRYVWAGSWAEKDGGMVLDLQRPEARCEQTVTDRGAAAPPAPCPEMPGALALACRAERLSVGETFISPDSAKRPYEIWRCVLKEGTRVRGSTPFSWVLGKAACIETATGPGGMSHQLCPKGDGGAP